MFKLLKTLVNKCRKAKVRHYFIVPVRDGANDLAVEEQVQMMRNVKNKIPQIKALNVGRNKQFVGGEDMVFMSVDFASVEDLEIFLDSPQHANIFVSIFEVLKIEEMISGQVMIE